MRKPLMKVSTVCLSIIDTTPTRGKTVSTELSIVISVVQYYYTLRRKTKNGTLTYKKSGKRFSFIVLFPLFMFVYYTSIQWHDVFYMLALGLQLKSINSNAGTSIKWNENKKQRTHCSFVMLSAGGVPCYVQNSRKMSTPELNIDTKPSSHDPSELKTFILHLPTPIIKTGNKSFARIQ